MVALEGAWQPESLLAMEASKLGQSVVLPKEASQLESAEADGRRRRVEVESRLPAAARKCETPNRKHGPGVGRL